MASRFEVERAYARRSETAGDLLGAAVHVAAAARTTSRHPLKLTALAELTRLADEALAQGISDAHAAGYSWREIGDRTGLPWQSLHRKYRRSPHLP